ncbi:hypothetical protein A3860_08855 [Niastella vici]|uniref:Methyltransferase domain-containing protein n=1 Tax=Niastella vici TaxID=1703345 RepID=A0A1V9FH72_9BACT|nr:class I SAM-dependent methyltransferase [Niastella vici]OQP57729.1 hypothetical protein A3860_08855 [Niastella vici]
MAQKIETGFFDQVVNRKMYSSKKNLKFHLDNLFEHVELAQKEVLDVGGGKGLLTFYAAIKGAKKAICLEPEQAGSTRGVINAFRDLQQAFPATLPVELMPFTLQEFLQQTKPATFDVVIMYNSINHLDEEACIHLLKNETSYRRYVNIFKNVYRVMKKKATLIVTDCSCNNFFNDVGMKNRLVPTIEWHKHQQPHTWIKLLKESGFRNPEVVWLSPNRLGRPGRFFFGNYFISYLTTSFFKISIEK